MINDNFFLRKDVSNIQSILLVLQPCGHNFIKENKLITVIVTFKISDEFDADILKEKFIETSSLYQDVTGLRRKNYIADLENHTAGGVYTFDSMQDAKNWFDEDRINWITNRYSKPDIKFFESPVVVDNEKNQILS